MKDTDRRILTYILEKIDRLMDICNNHPLEEIEGNYLLSDALQFEYEKIYNDCTKLSPEFIIEQKSFPIDQLRGIRNRVAHDYEHVSIRILYDTVIKDMPSLKETIENLLNK